MKRKRKDVGNEMKIGFVIVCVLVIAIGGIMSCSTVPAGHKGVLTTFGKVHGDVEPEGLVIKAPWTRVHDVSIQQVTVTSKTGCYSSDQQQLEVSYAVLYRIPETKVVSIFREYPGDPFAVLIKPRIEECLKQVMSTMRAEDSITKRGHVKDETLLKLNAVLGDLITINDLSITNIDLSSELEKAIERKQVAEQQALAMNYELQRAKKAAEIKIVDATAEAEAITIRGEALNKSPSVVMLNAIEKWNGIAPATLVVGSDTGISLIPNGHAADK